jgi:hypothetical protein
MTRRELARIKHEIVSFPRKSNIWFGVTKSVFDIW